MDARLFLFDLDSTITRVEILPTIAESAGCAKKMRELTEQSMYQAVPFRQSFLERVELLKSLEVSQISSRIAEIPLNEALVEFMKENKERCYIVTGNLDVWIDGLVERMGMAGHVFCSRGIVKDDRLVGVASVNDKNATVGQLVGDFVAVGDGSNDAEMISRAEIGIGYGGVRPIAPSLLEVCSHAFYDEGKLVQFLNRLTGNRDAEPESKSVVISCAGMGKRLGIGTTKCLLDVDGKQLIMRHLEQLDGIDDVRVVVGYQADKVIDAVRQRRNDATFVFNHDYAHNGTGASVALAAKYANEYVVTIDGDLLIHPADMSMILESDGEFIGVTAPGTDNPVLTSIRDGKVIEFSRERGSFEWTGVTQAKSSTLAGSDGHVYQLIEPYLPTPYLYLRTKEIDTQNDYDKAVRWVRNGYSDEVVIGVVGGMGTYATVDLFKRLAEAIPADKEWDRPRIIVDNYCTMPSVVRAALYGERRDELAEMLAKSIAGLIDAGCTHVLYACNMSHVFLDDVSALLPNARDYLVDAIDLLACDMQRAGIARAYLLASEEIIQTGIYQDRFMRYGIAIEAADAEQQVSLRDLIDVVKQNKVTADEVFRFGRYLESLEEKVVILGCAELPVLYGQLDASGFVGLESTIIFDPMQSAIDEIVREFRAAREADQRKA